MGLEKREKIIYGFAIVILIFAIIMNLIDKNSAFYWPLTYVAAGLVVIALIIIITSLIKKKKH